MTVPHAIAVATGQRQQSQVYSGQKWLLAGLAWSLLFAVALLIYWPGIHAGYFGDDLLFVFIPSAEPWWQPFVGQGNVAHAYRPLEAVILTQIQKAFGWSTWPIHAWALGMHTALAVLVYAMLKRLAYSSIQASIATAFLLIAQTQPFAVLGNDTSSQVGSAFFGYLGVASFYLSSQSQDRPRYKGRFLSLLGVVCYAISLLFKETGIGFLLVITFCAAIQAIKILPLRFAFGTAVPRLLPYAFVTGIYLIVRLSVGAMAPSGGEDTYNLVFGFNIPRNIIAFFAAALNPVSTVSTAVFAQQRNSMALVFITLAVLLVVAVTAIGIVRSGRPLLTLCLLSSAIATMVPAVLLRHVSELYVYNTMPFIAALVGLGIGSLIEYSGRTKAIATTVFLLAFLFGHVLAVREKAAMLNENGHRAQTFLNVIASSLSLIPAQGKILLLSSQTYEPAYSVFLVPGLDVLRFGVRRIGALYGRNDVHIQLVKDTVDLARSGDANVSVFTLEDGVLRLKTF